MAVYILIVKEEEDDSAVVYRFGPNEETIGKLLYNKKSQTFSELEPVFCDNSKRSEFYFNRAAQKLAKAIIKDREYPDKTCWAS